MQHYSYLVRKFFLGLSFFHCMLFAATAVAFDSLCIYEAKPGVLVSLKQCGLSAPNQHRHVVKGGASLSNKGYIGYYYTDTQSTNAIGMRGYSYYRIVGQIGSQQIVQTVNNTGGNGEFTGLYRIDSPDDTHIVVNPIALGDRCNGGIVQAKVQNTVVQYQQNITGYGLYALIQKNHSTQSPQLTPYTDLADCAVCCLAKASYQLSPSGLRSEAKLMHVDLGKDLNQLLDNNQGQYQNCFNRVLASVQQSQGSTLYPTQFGKVLHLFKKQCKK